MAETSYPSDAASALLVWLRERSRWRNSAGTPVDTLARLLRLDIAEFDAALHPGVWGYLEPGEDLIFLRAGLSDAARRFTLAHEIGHAVLHRDRSAAAQIAGMNVHRALDDEALLAACESSDVESYDFSHDETLSPGQAYSARAVVEQEANAFAVALLMPEAPFLEAYLALFTRARPANETRGVTRLLAKRFGVSEDAALRRLQWLLLPTIREATQNTSPSSRKEGSDPDQRAAARLEAPALVMAGPGSGKTSTLVSRIAHLIDERGARPDQILALTFSRKAAAELRERADGALLGADARVAPYISTIHSFCFDLLGRYGQLIGLPSDIQLASELELYFLLRQVMRGAGLRYLSPPYAPDLYVRDIQQAISRAKDDLIGPAEMADAVESALRDAVDGTKREAAERQREYAVIFTEYQRSLREQRTIDYGDVIVFAVRLLAERREIAREVAARWPYILVDEYQDINHAIGAVLQELASSGCGLWAVGDADQAIYRFRGAEPGVVHRFEETFPGARVVSLVHNYRSRHAILDVASVFAATFSRTNGRLPLVAARAEDGTGAETNAAVRIVSAETSEDELAGLARAIEERYRGGRAYRDQVALLRTRRQVEQVVMGLAARGIPTYSLANALDRDIVKRCVAVMSLLCEPSGAGLIRAGLQAEHSFTRDDATALLREARRQRKSPLDMLRIARSVKGVSPAGQVAMRRLGRILVIIRSARSVAAGLCLYLFSLTSIGAGLLAGHEENTIDAASVRRLLDFARAFDGRRTVGAVSPDIESGVVDWKGFAEYLRAASTLRLDTLEDIAGYGGDAVRVMTVHASKGLEFPVVYLPQLVNRRFPITGRAPLVARVGRGVDAEEDAGLSDEASLFYVAMTRARDELVLSFSRRYGRASYTVSPFLDQIGQAMGERVPREQWGGTAVSVTIAPDPEGKLASSLVQTNGSATLFELAELETYQRCPKQYAYRYVDNLWSSTSLMSLFSRATRRASQDIARAISQRREQGGALLTREEALAYADERWRTALEDDRVGADDMAGLRDATLEAYYSRQTRAAAEAYWTRLIQQERGRDEAHSSIGETRFRQATIHVGEIEIRGEIETTLSSSNPSTAGAKPPDGQIAEPERVVRYRNGRSSVSPTLRDLFADIAAQDGGPGGVIAHDLTTGSSANVLLSTRQRARLTREALEAASGIIRRDFHANPDEWQCQHCPFAVACPE